jgi:hypothetical protein
MIRLILIISKNSSLSRGIQEARLIHIRSPPKSISLKILIEEGDQTDCLPITHHELLVPNVTIDSLGLKCYTGFTFRVDDWDDLPCPNRQPGRQFAAITSSGTNREEKPLSKRYYICYECGHKFESEEGKPITEDPKDCPACHSSNITVYAVRLGGENMVPVGGCDTPNGYT